MVPYLDLRAQYSSIKAEISLAIQEVLDRQEFVLGSEVEAFEREFATACQAEHAVAVHSGTAALHLALIASGVGPGDEVITSPFSFVATVATVRYCGAKPVFVDIDPTTFNIDVRQIESHINARTKAIIPVHLFGQAADMDPIMRLADRFGFKVIEDAAQAHLAEYQGKKTGTIGDFGAFSFYPGKNLGAYGEGGMVTCRSAEDAEKLRMMRNWGARRRYHHEITGFNYRLDALQAAILRVKLRHLPEWTAKRQRNADLYRRLLSSTGDLALPALAGSTTSHVYNVFAVRSPRRDQLAEFLATQGITTAVNYPLGLHQQPAHADLGYEAGDFPHAELAAKQQLSLPIYPELTHHQIESVSSAIRQFSVSSQPSSPFSSTMPASSQQLS